MGSVSTGLGKFISKALKSDTTGAVKEEVEHLSKMKEMVAKKKNELEEISKSGDKEDKYYSKIELERRAENKAMKDALKERESTGDLSKKQVENRININKKRPMSGESMRDSVQKAVDRESDDMDFNKGGMVKKYAKGGMVKKYAQGGMIKANCGASVPPAQKAKKK